MKLAPLSCLRRVPPRMSHNGQMSYRYADAQNLEFRIDYLEPTKEQPFSFRQVFAATRKGNPHQGSFFTPPPHYHLLQDEHFIVETGEGIWHLEGVREVRLRSGDTLKVEARKRHWFEVAPNSTEDLSVVYFYDKGYKDMEDRFFRNLFGDMADRRRAGMDISIFQLSVFCLRFWMPIGLVKVGPEWLKLVLNTCLMLILAFVGECMLGYKSSYDEYYQPGSKSK
ncbi:hypothetical protein KVT40_003866 [Elsinoe batatas]|uniref:Cupin type-2 domain-containing protein n=1 Tax=Elsinoe batatas TaxID=2601811 RepID=A0A8K0L4F9_9PEZI|nr:hypothetical protein KVT40_003866 [Elsinoe batatas]